MTTAVGKQVYRQRVPNTYPPPLLSKVPAPDVPLTRYFSSIGAQLHIPNSVGEVAAQWKVKLVPFTGDTIASPLQLKYGSVMTGPKRVKDRVESSELGAE
ncbi:MAG TPA: hypothetical protein VML94_00195 [Thermoplasmata archaeon]|nr:hypothetical protein [Thermoplasmata archaeon]